MKVLFLDIDGVLNSFDNQFALEFNWKCDTNYKSRAELKSKSRDEYGTLFDERCVNWLRYIIKKTDCKIVISSTWRLSGIEALKKMWSKRMLPGEIIGITPIETPIEIYQKYYNDMAVRGFEIQTWLDSNKVDSYCIVDDEADMLPGQKFVKTSGRIGLNYETAKSIVHILNN